MNGAHICTFFFHVYAWPNIPRALSLRMALAAKVCLCLSWSSKQACIATAFVGLNAFEGT
jgi:hypothetical protein